VGLGKRRKPKTPQQAAEEAGMAFDAQHAESAERGKKRGRIRKDYSAPTFDDAMGWLKDEEK
jgi:hypothetical protein